MSSRIIEPELGFSKPANRFKNVVLPDPLFPEIRFNTPESKLKSKSKNAAIENRKLQGKVLMTYLKGESVFNLQ